MTPQEVQERFKLSQLKDKIWYGVPSCAAPGEGSFEGLVGLSSPVSFGGMLTAFQGWLSNNVKTAPATKKA